MRYANYIAYCVIFLAISFGIYIKFSEQKDSYLISIRTGIIEDRTREKEATKDREEWEDKLSQALWDQCYAQALTLTWVRFVQKQNEAYECWKSSITSELIKIKNWTYTWGTTLVPWVLISNPDKHANINSALWNSQKRVSMYHSEILWIPEAHAESVGETEKNNKYTSKVTTGSTPEVTITGKNVSQGKKSDYWIAYETAITLLRKWEGYAPIAKWDYKQCSGGYGHKAPCGQAISKEQADRWLASDTKAWLEQVQKDFPNLHPEWQGALASFKHNCPAWYASVQKNGLKYFNSWCRSVDGVRIPGLVNRHDEEWELISSKK